MNKTIFIYWHQGWDEAPLLQQHVLKSWIYHNPDWKIELICFENLSEFLDNIPYIYNSNKQITLQALSDIIRLSLLDKFGGIWADSTLLCLQPMNNLIDKNLFKEGFWMYRGNGANMDIRCGPCSWFLFSNKNNYIIKCWKKECDNYWNSINSCHDYFWMDCLFKNIYNSNNNFKLIWNSVPVISCEEKGSSHCLTKYGMFNNSTEFKEIIKSNPPFVLKLWKGFNEFVKTNSCKDKLYKNSNACYAISKSVNE